jgi:hypothetical protein
MQSNPPHVLAGPFAAPCPFFILSKKKLNQGGTRTRNHGRASVALMVRKMLKGTGPRANTRS